MIISSYKGEIVICSGSTRHKMNRQQLSSKISTVTSELLREKEYISFVDLFLKLGYLNPKDYENWRFKRVPDLERVIKVNLSTINFIVKTVCRSSLNGNLKPSWTGYMSWGKGRKIPLRFSKSGDENIEHAYATHFVASRKPKAKPKN